MYSDSDNQLKMSFYELILFWFHHSNCDNYKECLKKVNINIDNTDLMTELKNKCQLIGKYGWVYSPFVETEPYRTVTYIDDWMDALESGDEERIDKYFTDYDYGLLKCLYGRIIDDLININQYRLAFGVKESLDNFFDKRYISCAHVLFSTLEGLIRSCKIKRPRWRVIPFFNDTTKAEFEQTSIDNKIDKISFFAEKNLMLPSLDEALSRYYSLDSAHQFGNKDSIEPKYIQRNWLLHGMTDRIVSRRECIQLFNAIATFLGMRTDLADS